ncbi:coiled-coil domain-containing protein 74B-like isoform X2 [Mytilus trossulus]|uniref:coiled-coil domain-containing protein 74B-like isoform X2 n=1 Tax=Mytilus trossulus TaxID=6551 RepID=UPI003007A4A1
MIKQGVVQEKIADLSMNQLPPLSNLPQWSRINTLDRGRYPKPFVKDKHNPNVDGKKDEESEEDKDVMEMNPTQRIHHLERSIGFLKQQHQEVLRCLHEEIEALKKENKDLQFKIIMSQKNQQQSEKRSASTNSHKSRKEESRSRGGAGMDKEERIDELKIIFLEEEIKELKHALREARNRNTYLTNLLEQAEDVKKKQSQKIETLQYQVTQGGGPLAEQLTSGNITLFNNPQRPPALSECEAVIRHLQHVNEQQKHELDSLKSDLRDVLYSHKWTPDAYLLAKAYIAEDDAKEQDKTLPKLTLKNPSRKLPDIAYINHDSVVLPALKQTVGNKAAERRKRTQILQKARLRKEVLP